MTSRLEQTHIINVQLRDKNQFVGILHTPPLLNNSHRVREANTFEVSWDQWVAAKAKAETL